MANGADLLTDDTVVRIDTVLLTIDTAFVSGTIKTFPSTTVRIDTRVSGGRILRIR